jgi:putative DNA primase/helicase
MAELAAIEGVYVPQEKAAPASLDGKLDSENIIALNNCMLDVSTIPPKVMKPAKEFYTFGYLPFDYDPHAKCPQWEKFLSDIFTATGDELAVSILQEWFGYLVTYGTYLQKIFALTGPAHSGKSTIVKVLRALVGNGNTASPSLTSLATKFGLQPLIDKTVAVIDDADMTGRSPDVARAIERLKSISREDAQQVRRRHGHYVEVNKLGVRIVMIADKIQDLRDSAGTIADRFNFLVTTQNFPGREDMHLEKRLMTELAGIFNWSLKGLKRLRDRGYIQEHPVGIEAREDFKDMSSLMKAFVDDCCIVKSAAFVPVDILWQAHCNWARENCGRPYSRRGFIIEIKEAWPAIRRDRQRLKLSYLKEVYNWQTPPGDNRMSVLYGIDLSEDCKNKWDSGTSGTGEVYFD